jgi:AGZA family xanthine/uracil permease-like MFS transporter
MTWLRVSFRRMARFLDRYFEVTAKGSTIRTELLAGVSTFLVLSYIFIVNPAILGDAGIDRSAVLFATILVSGISTIAMGLWARLPFVLAPGMEMNAYITYFAVGVVGLTWREALGAVFWSGVLFISLSALQVRQKIIEAIPPPMAASLSLCVGLFIALIACRIAGILTFQGVHISGLGLVMGSGALVLYVGVVTALFLDHFKVKAAVLLSIIVSATLCRAIGLTQSAPSVPLSRHPFAALGALDFGVIGRPSALSIILVLFLVDFYGSIAKLLGLTTNTSIQENGRVPRLRRALLVDSLATTSASIAGTSNITVYVESGVGIAAGGRTGLTALVCGVLMLSVFGIAPLLYLVPLVATTGALVFIAIKLIPNTTTFRGFSLIDVLALILMQCCVLATLALDRAILAGLVVYALAAILVTRKRPNVYALASIALLMLGVYFTSAIH